MSRGALLIKRPSPFVFPGGNPGFDPAHIASKNILGSAVTHPSSGFFDLLHAQPGTYNNGTAAYAAFVSAILGVVTTPGVNSWVSYPIPAASYLPVTFGIIFQLTASGVTNIMGGAAWRIVASTAGMNVVSNGVSNMGTRFTVAVGVPYFFAISAQSANSNWILVNLLTGQVQSAAAGGTGTPLSESAWTIPGSTGLTPAGTATIAAGMISNAFMSMAQLLEWAQDPWSFWYPRKLDHSMMLRAPAVGGGFTPDFRKTLSSMGTRIGSRQSQAA